MSQVARSHADDGVTLIELIVVVVLVGILGGSIATILLNSWNAQNDVTSTTHATDRGQLVGQSIERAVRNAQAIDVSPDGSMLRVHTTRPAGRACQAFWINGGSIYMTQRSGALPTAVVTSWPNPWQDSVVPHAGASFFSLAGNTVNYAFDISTDSAPVAIVGQESMRAPSTGVTAPCW